MARASVRLVSDGTNTGKYVDTCEITVGGTLIERQVVVTGDPSADNLQAVKAGSVPAALTDPAAVVSLSPNSAIGKAHFRDLGTQQSVKAAPGTLFGLQILNNQAAICYVQIFDAAAGITLGTEEPVMEFMVAANAQLDIPIPARGIAFGTGIRVASTTLEKGSAASAAGVQLFAQFA